MTVHGVRLPSNQLLLAMMKKNIAAACAVFLAFASVSCQKSDVDRCLDTQTELVETLQKINDRDSADKYADEVGALMEQFLTLFNSIDDRHEDEKLKKHPQWRPSWNQMEKLSTQIRDQEYYGSEKLHSAFLKGRGK